MTGKTSLALSFVAIAILAGLQVWVSHLRYETSIATAETVREQHSIKREIHSLGLELASLSRPENLRRIAASELGMAPPRPMQVLRP